MLNGPDDSNLLNVNSLPAGVHHHIFSYLGPRDLCAVSGTCKLWFDLNRDAASNRKWKHFYSKKWRVQRLGPAGSCWQEMYGSKMQNAKSWTGRFIPSNLHAHRGGVRSIQILPHCNLLATGEPWSQKCALKCTQIRVTTQIREYLTGICPGNLRLCFPLSPAQRTHEFGLGYGTFPNCI